MEGSQSTFGGAVTVADEDDPFAGPVQREELAIGEARRLIEPLDNFGYDMWLGVGMALHYQFKGSEEALSLWDEWSRTAGNYQGIEVLRRRWDGFKPDPKEPRAAAWLKKVSRDARESLRKAEKNDALDEIKSLVGGCDNPIDLLNDVASRVGTLAQGDAALRAVAEGAVRSRFKDLTGNAILTVEVRRALDKGRRALKQGQSKRHPDTELGNTDRMIDGYGDTLLFAKDTKQWYRWNGVHWKPIYEADMIYLALETVRALPDEIAQIKDDQERLGFFDFCKLSQRESMVRHMLILAQADERVGIVSTDLDRHMHLLGVGNGVVDLRTGELLPPDPTHMISIITPVEYDPRAKAPLFEATLLDACNGDVNLAEFNKRTYGYAILGNPREQVMAIPYGSGANGKSTILNTVRDVLGDHATNASSGVFLSNGRKGTQTGGQPELLVLRGKRFVYVDEPDQGAELRESLVKTITGNDKISARWMYSNAMVNFKPSWVAFMPTNHRPIVKGDDYAIWRRLLTIPFTRNFDKDPTAVKDPDRAEKLKAEYQGLLALLIQYAMKYQKEGLNPPPDVHRAREDYKQDMDLLADWLYECCELGGGCVSSNAELWTSWSAFARDRGELDYIKSARALGRRLSGREGLTSVQRTAGMRGRGFRGIKVKRVGDFE